MQLRLQSHRHQILFAAGIAIVCLLVTNIVNYLAFGPLLFSRVALVTSMIAICLSVTISYWVGGKLLAISQLTRQLQYALHHDNLTGVSTRRHFFERAEGNVQYPATLVMVDVDHFKAINDKYGHDTGDQALIHVAQTLQAELRPCDCIARFGGEEFVALIVGATLEQGARVAQRMCATLERVPIVVAGETIQLTASFGVTLVETPADLDAAIRCADTALYEAKDGGRNQVVTFPVSRLRGQGVAQGPQRRMAI